jgi:hypothetical protein
LLSTFLVGANVGAQLRLIDLAKLPQDPRVQATYHNVLPIESMTHYWSPKWVYDTPKTQVASLLRSSLRNLRSVESAAPQNVELLLFTGIVAHLAYNVDVEQTYEVAVQSFEYAKKLAPADYRAEWFLASHRCQSNEVLAGMEQMLAVEARTAGQQLPVDFWDDYINCSTVSRMPAHTLWGADRAIHLGEAPLKFSSAVDAARHHFKSTDANSIYKARDAWNATQEQRDILFTSQLCGMRLTAHNDWHMDIRDVSNGTCLLTIETGPYPSKSGQGIPTILALTRNAKPEERLDDFVESFLKKYPSARAIKAPSCPSDKCVAFEIVANTMYQSEGGGHLLAVGFAEKAPDFPGLLFEKPDVPPNKPGKTVKYYFPADTLQRLPGVLYTVVILDSNESIFDKAAADFYYLLQSIQLD